MTDKCEESFPNLKILTITKFRFGLFSLFVWSSVEVIFPITKKMRMLQESNPKAGNVAAISLVAAMLRVRVG